MALQTANQFQLTPSSQAIPRLQASQQNTQRLAQGRQVIAQNDQSLALNRANFLGESITSIRALPLELRQGAVDQLTPRLAEFGIPADSFRGADLSNNALDQALAGIGRFKAQPPAEQFTLGQGQTRFGGAGDVIASVAAKVDAKDQPSQIAPLPESITANLSDATAQKARDVFQAAGGGKDGMTAVQKVLDKAPEQERRAAAPELVKASFPNASPAEMEQVQAAMAGANTTEAGLKAAGKVREDQRRLKKAKVFQDKAVSLMQDILNHPELDDVLGSVEGRIDFRLQDSEAELITNIEEAVNILTSDNMDLMTGVLSETDIAILKSISGGALNRKRSEPGFRKAVQEVIDRLSSEVVQTIDDTTDFSNTSDDDLLRF